MAPLAKPQLSIVIVNWNTRDLLENCLNSVYSNCDDLEIEIIVVDNASSDDSQIMVSSLFPKVKLLASDVNLGFAKANNIAFRHCSADYIMLLNSDVTIHSSTLTRLVSFLDETPQAGAVAPKIVHPHLRLRVLSCGYQPTLQTVFNHYFGLSTIFPYLYPFRGLNLLTNIHDDKVRAVEWLSGACIVVRKSVIEKSGELNEDWFMYAEDMEWCLRMTRDGWRLYHIPDVTVDHLLGASSKKDINVSAMWVQSLLSYYQFSQRPNALQYLLFQLIMASGLGIRSTAYWIKGIMETGKRQMWWDESAQFRLYARAAIRR